MYRPSRIGPYSLVTLESDIVTVAAASVEGAVVLNASLGAFAQKAVPNVATAAETIRGDGAISIPANSNVAIGVKVSGGQLWSGGEYILSYGGACRCLVSDTDVTVSPVVGRADVNGLSAFELPQAALVPSLTEHSILEQPGAMSQEVSANGSVILGDWAPEGAFLENELFFGFLFMNSGADPSTISELWQSTSVHRYEGDLHPFDPNR